jgi:hypothetical protein
MRPLAQWSFFRVLLVCTGWVVLCLLVPVLWVAIQLREQMAVESAAGSGGIGAVSFAVNELVVLLPPLVFYSAWIWTRQRARRRR